MKSNIRDEWTKYSILAGACDVKGPGVEITVDDGKRDLYAGEDINNLLVHDIDILMNNKRNLSFRGGSDTVNGAHSRHARLLTVPGWSVR